MGLQPGLGHTAWQRSSRIDGPEPLGASHTFGLWQPLPIKLRHQKCLDSAKVVVCEEKNTLLARCGRALDGHAEAVRQLRARMGVCPKEEYVHLKRIADNARNQVSRALLMFERHILAHRCEQEEEKVMAAGKSYD